MAKHKKSRRSRRSRKSRRSLGCVGCGPGGGGGPTLSGLLNTDSPRPIFKYALIAAAAYFVYTRYIKPGGRFAGLGDVITFDRNSAGASFNRPQAGVAVEVPSGYHQW